MDEEKPQRRKMKFAPKAPPKRVPKPEVKTELVENDESGSSNAAAIELLRRVKESSLRKAKVEKKVPAAQVAWMGGVVNSTRSNKYLNGSAGANGATSTPEIEYKEPWDYYSYYPITLPLRRPYSGDPEVLDVEEFMQEPVNHEDSLNSAATLGLMEDSEEQRMLLMRLPPILPMETTTENAETKPNVKGAGSGKKTIDLKDMPAGLMGKLLVYKSGVVKMKVGEVLFEVSPGLKNEFAQDVMMVNTEEKNSVLVGELQKHVMVTPDIYSILDNIEKL